MFFCFLFIVCMNFDDTRKTCLSVDGAGAAKKKLVRSSS